MRHRPSSPDRTALAILLWVAATLTLLYWQGVAAPATAQRMLQHERILTGTMDAPYRYRVLAVWVTEGVIRLLAPVLGAHRAFQAAYLGWDLLGAFGFLAGLFALLRRWFGTWRSLVGALLAVPALLLAFGNAHYFYMPWSVAEGAFATWGLLFALSNRWGALALMTVLAALNRETGLFVALYAAAALPRAGEAERPSPLAARWLPLALWAATYGALRLALGAAPRTISIRDILALNLGLASLVWALVLLALFAGPMWMLAPTGWKRAPAQLRRAAAVLPLVAALYLVFGIWREVRILLPALPVLIALTAWAAWRPADPPSAVEPAS